VSGTYGGGAYGSGGYGSGGGTGGGGSSGLYGAGGYGTGYYGIGAGSGPIGYPPLQVPTWTIQIAFGFGPSDVDPLWTDVTDFCRQFSTTGGRQHELDRIEATKLQMVLDDRTGIFTPANTLSPLYNQLSVGDSIGLPASAGSGTGTWHATSGSYALVTGGRLTSGAPTLYGTQGGSFTSTTTNIAVVSTAPGTSAYPVVPGSVYYASAFFRAAGVSEPVTLGLQFYDSAGASLGAPATVTVTSSSAIALGSTGDWVWANFLTPAPTGAATASLYVASTLSSGAKHYFSCAMLSNNPNGVQVSWNLGQLGPLVPCTPILIEGTWAGSGTQDVAYCYADTWDPQVKDALNQDTMVSGYDILGLLGQTPLSNSLLYPNAVMALQPLDYWRLGDPPRSTVVAPYFAGQPLVGTTRAGMPNFGGSDVVGAGLSQLFTSSSTGSGSGAIIYDPAYATNMNNDVEGLIAKTPLFSGPHDWSLVCLVHFGSQGGANLFSTYSAAGAWQFSLGVNDGTYGGHPNGTLMATGGSVTATTGGANFLDDAWHFLAIVAPASGGHLLVYVDTHLVLTVPQSASTTPVGTGDAANGSLLLGAAVLTSGDQPQTNYQDLAIYNFQLSGAVGGDMYNLYETYHLLQGLELSGQRLAHVMVIAGFASYPTIFDVGTVTVAPETASQTSNAALDYMQTVADTELGYLFQTPDGILHFHDMRYPAINPTSNSPQATLGDNPSAQMRYVAQNLKTPQDSLDLWTDVQVQANQSNTGAGTMQEVTISNRIGPPGGFGRRSLQRTGLLFAYDSDALSQATTLAMRYSSTQRRVDSVEIHGESFQGNNIPYMLGLYLWDSVQFQRQGYGESPWVADMLIEHIEHKWEADPGQFTTTWVLSPYEVLALSDVPIGGIIIMPGAAWPANFALCNGAPVSRSTYSALFANIGIAYGAGDGSTTFNLPNFVGPPYPGPTVPSFPMGASTAHPLGTYGGSQTITVAQTPNHGHSPTGTGSTTVSVSDPGHVHLLYVDPAVGGGSTSYQLMYTTPGPGPNPVGGGSVNWTSNAAAGIKSAATSVTATASTTVSVSDTSIGGGNPYLQPYVAMNFIIRLI